MTPLLSNGVGIMIDNIIMHLEQLQAVAESKVYTDGISDEQVLYLKEYMATINKEIDYLKDLKTNFN
jgi:hypothetical protein